MRPFLAFALLFACTSAQEGEPARTSPDPPSTAARSPVEPPLHLESHRRVSWGYGCGGNCAQNTRGDSVVALDARGRAMALEDKGTTSTTFSSPGSLRTSARTWSLSWRGTLEDGDTAMTLRLTSGSGSCEESEGEGTGTVDCKHPAPTRLLIACTREQIDVTNAKRPAWRCEPDPPIPAGEWSGTPFPWVFGIDDPIDTVHAGEPEPKTRYQLRAEAE